MHQVAGDDDQLRRSILAGRMEYLLHGIQCIQPQQCSFGVSVQVTVADLQQVQLRTWVGSVHGMSALVQVFLTLYGKETAGMGTCERL